MTRRSCWKVLKTEVGRWGQKSFGEIQRTDFSDTIIYNVTDDNTVYHVEVDLLCTEQEFIQMGLSVYDGGISSLSPPGHSIVYRRDGKVDTGYFRKS